MLRITAVGSKDLFGLKKKKKKLFEVAETLLFNKENHPWTMGHSNEARLKLFTEIILKPVNFGYLQTLIFGNFIYSSSAPAKTKRL